MIRTLLLDVDGVIVTGEHFADCLKRDFGLTPEDTKDFFGGIFRECGLGKTDLKEAIAPFLPRWGWQKGVDEFLEYWFTSHNKTDQALLQYVQDLRTRGIKVYVAANQEKYRAEYLWNVLGLKDFFDAAFFSWQVGHFKKDPGFFEHVLHELDKPPEKVMYFDDLKPEIERAKAVGIQAHLYIGYKDLV